MFNLIIGRKEKNGGGKCLNFSLTLLLLIRINQGNSNQDGSFVYPVALCSVLCRIWELMLLYPKYTILYILYELFKETLYTGEVFVSGFKPKCR